MAQSSTLVELAAGLEAAANDLSGDTMLAIIRDSVALYDDAITQALSDETGGSMRLRIGSLQVNSEASAKQGRVWVTGPWWLVDQRTAAHPQAPRGSGRSGARKARGGSRRRALKLHDDTFAAHVQHPGTPGKDQIGPAVRTVEDRIDEIAGNLVVTALRRDLT